MTEIPPTVAQTKLKQILLRGGCYLEARLRVCQDLSIDSLYQYFREMTDFGHPTA